MRLQVYPTASSLSANAVGSLVLRIVEVLSVKEICSIAVSGGSMPASFSSLGDVEDIDWKRCVFLFADERCVPLSHDDSNYYQWSKEVFSKINIPRGNILTISEELCADPVLAAEAYENLLIAKCGGIIDILFLGMGPDGHTASLFPNHDLLSYIGPKFVVPITDSPKPPPSRITLTLTKINESADVIM